MRRGRCRAARSGWRRGVWRGCLCLRKRHRDRIPRIFGLRKGELFSLVRSLRMCRGAGICAPIQSNHLRGGRQGLTPAPSEEDENLRSAYFRKLIFQTGPRAKYRPRDFALDWTLGVGVIPSERVDPSAKLRAGFLSQSERRVVRLRWDDGGRARKRRSIASPFGNTQGRLRSSSAEASASHRRAISRFL